MKKIFTYLLAISLLFIGEKALAATPATLYFSPVNAQYSIGQIVNTHIIVDPKGNNYDTVGADITFPPDLLEVKKVSINPIFSHGAPENEFNNTTGTLWYGAGIPGGSNDVLNFATITFLVKKEGAAKITINPSSLILSGGENIFTNTPSAINFSIAGATPPPQNQVIARRTPTLPVKKSPNVPAATPNNSTAPDSPVIEENNIATAALTPSVIPVIDAVQKSDWRTESWRFALPLLLILLIGGTVFAVYKRYEKA